MKEEDSLSCCAWISSVIIIFYGLSSGNNYVEALIITFLSINPSINHHKKNPVHSALTFIIVLRQISEMSHPDVSKDCEWSVQRNMIP